MSNIIEIDYGAIDWGIDFLSPDVESNSLSLPVAGTTYTVTAYPRFIFIFTMWVPSSSETVVNATFYDSVTKTGSCFTKGRGNDLSTASYTAMLGDITESSIQIKNPLASSNLTGTYRIKIWY